VIGDLAGAVTDATGGNALLAGPVVNVVVLGIANRAGTPISFSRQASTS
jgi:Na+/H+ antiporter NhaD/arsenite permease-like protein